MGLLTPCDADLSAISNPVQGEKPREPQTAAEVLENARRVQNRRDGARPVQSPWATRVAQLESELRNARMDADLYQARCARLQEENTKLVERLAKLELEPSTLNDLHGLPITLNKINRVVCHHYQMTLNDLVSHRRQKMVMEARHVAMYLCKLMTTKTLVQIAKVFGDRDHTTIMCAHRNIETRVKTDADLKKKINDIMASIRK